MQHSNVSYPVVKVIMVDGHPVNIRRKGGGTYGELAAAFAQEIIKSLPQNSIALQEVKHANRPVDVGSAVDPGVPVRVGAVQRGSEK